MTRVRAGDVWLDYEARGAGEPLLMIHGLGYGKWGWSWNAPPLAERFHVVTFDNRGIGGSDAPAGPYTVAQLAADSVALLDALGIRRAHVIGTSLGGFIAQHMAVEYPERVDRLVLACTTCGGPDMVPMPERTVKLLLEVPSLPDDVRLRRSTENGFSDSTVRERQDLVEAVMAFRRTTAQPFEAWLSQSAAGASFDLSGRVGEITAPTLVMTGDSDAVVDPRNAGLLAGAIPGARRVEMAGGHLFFIENASEFNRVVVEFLEDSGGAAVVRQEQPERTSN
jgi:pimeloyl-ACP methyl ester carboxylesterase